jgi:hypothetical protein
MPPKKDKKPKKEKKPMKRTQSPKGKGQAQKQTQIVKISLGKSGPRRAAPKPAASRVPINMITLNTPAAPLPMQSMPLREPLKEPTAPSKLIYMPNPVAAPQPEPVKPMPAEPVKEKAPRKPRKSKEEKALDLAALEEARRTRPKGAGGVSEARAIAAANEMLANTQRIAAERARQRAAVSLEEPTDLTGLFGVK